MESTILCILYIMSFIYFELVFVCSVKEKVHFILLHTNIQLLQHNLLKRLIFVPLHCVDTFIENQLTINIRVYFSTLNYASIIEIELCVLERQSYREGGL